MAPMKSIETTLAAGLLALSMLALSGGPALAAADATIIVLTQVPCQFLESEGGIDRGYTTTKQADCEKINAKSGADRVAGAEPLKLKPGRYIFRVTNKNVPYGLGFWLRGDGLISRARLPSISGGGMDEGKTLDYEIELKAGNYVYSCPLNTTPDYKLVVE